VRADFRTGDGQISWRQDVLRFGCREVPSAADGWYGDDGKTYVYSGITNRPRPWTALLLALKAKAEGFAESAFNSVLLNYYRDGSDSVGWHADNEPELGKRPVIASLSFGATRTFELRRRTTGRVAKFPLTSGSIWSCAGQRNSIGSTACPRSPAAPVESISPSASFTDAQRGRVGL